MMDTENLIKVLDEQSFFTGLSPEQMVVLASTAAEVDYSGGVEVFEEGGRADAAYLILEGAVALELHVTNRAHHIVQTLHESEVLGWGWLFPPHRWSFSARTLEPTKVVRFDAIQLRAAWESDCELGYEMMKRFAQVMTGRLAATRLQLVDFYGDTH
ncbi:MAG: cyclic nucleotide-binding domain-containing protein [Acidimicrobiia bacterium]|nr:cyclic nucleotide-binding domain-containing protein [Acidimicrobiia bacterium]